MFNQEHALVPIIQQITSKKWNLQMVVVSLIFKNVPRPVMTTMRVSPSICRMEATAIYIARSVLAIQTLIIKDNGSWTPIKLVKNL